MLFLLLWKGVGVCRRRFDSSNRPGDRLINSKPNWSTVKQEVHSDVIYSFVRSSSYVALTSSSSKVETPVPHRMIAYGATTR